MACLQFSKQLLKVLLRKMAYIMAEIKFLLLVIYEHHMTIFKESNIFMVSSQLLVVYKLMLMGPQEYYNTCRALLTHALKKIPSNHLRDHQQTRPAQQHGKCLTQQIWHSYRIL